MLLYAHLNKPFERYRRHQARLRLRDGVTEHVGHWVRKGPFACREILYTDEKGKEDVSLYVTIFRKPPVRRFPLKQWLGYLRPTKATWKTLEVFHRRAWPPKGAYFDLTDDEGLPVIYWRQPDLEPDQYANAQLNWAPRGCFVWVSRSEKQPPMFVNVNWDGALPARFTDNRALITVTLPCFLAFAAAVPFIMNSTHETLTNILLAGAGVTLLISVVFAFVDHYLIRFRHLSLLNLRVANRIWGGLIAPRVSLTPWDRLESFSTAEDPRFQAPIPKDVDLERVRPRDRMEANFGLHFRPVDVINGTRNAPMFREWLRVLTLHFIAKRQEYFAQIETIAPKLREFDRLRTKYNQLRESHTQHLHSAKLLADRLQKRWPIGKKFKDGNAGLEDADEGDDDPTNSRTINLLDPVELIEAKFAQTYGSINLGLPKSILLAAESYRDFSKIMRSAEELQRDVTEFRSNYPLSLEEQLHSDQMLGLAGLIINCFEKTNFRLKLPIVRAV
ncbi:MAG: hypothetical protein ACLPIX_06050 [Rhodomicrobium sp.]